MELYVNKDSCQVPFITHMPSPQCMMAEMCRRRGRRGPSSWFKGMTCDGAELWLLHPSSLLSCCQSLCPGVPAQGREWRTFLQLSQSLVRAISRAGVLL